MKFTFRGEIFSIKMNKRKLFNSFFIILYWIVAVNFFSIFSVITLKGFLKVAGIESNSITNVMAVYWISPSQYIEGIFAGTFLGLLFLFINSLSDWFHWDRLSFGRLVLLKSLSYGIGLVIIIASVYSIVATLGFYPDISFIEFEINNEMIIIFFMVISFIIFQIILLNYIIQTNQKIGDFNVISFITGKYRNPVLEERLFMFIDLRSSTSIAEKLTEVKYSQLIRDCFIDFNYCLKRFPSLDIYQYVGDEVVVTSKWNSEKDVVNMVSLYYQFSARLLKKSKHYNQNFLIDPFFKGGIHGGNVSVAEIGSLRRDIAFHGDVINTASRIQNLCNSLGKNLLISTSVFERYGEINDYKKTEIGLTELKGKEDKIHISSIDL